MPEAAKQQKYVLNKKWQRYAVGVCSAAAGLGLRFVLAPTLGSTVPYITFFPAVMFAAWFGGLGPGLLATFLSLIAALYFAIPPLYQFIPATSADAAGALVFIGVSIFVCVLNEALRRSRAASDRRFRELTLETARRVDAENALTASKIEAEQSRDLLQTTFSSIGDAVIATDADGTVTFLNQVAEELTGWTLAGAVGKAVAEVFAIRNEKTRALVECPVDQALREGVIVGLAEHTVLISKDGRDIPIEDSVAPIRYDDGRIRGAVLVFRDVTARRSAEAALKRSEERLRLAIDAGEIGVWDGDVIHNKMEWSDRIYDFHAVERGISPGGLDDFRTLLHPEDQERVGAALRAALDGGPPFDVEFRLIHPNGTIHWVATSALVIRNEDGQATRMLGATTDITARMEAASKLRESEERFREVFADAPIGMVLTDMEGKFLQANSAYCEIVGYSPEELKGIAFLSLTHSELAAENRRLFQQLLAGEIPSYVLEKQVRRKSGGFTWVRASSTILHSGEGRRREVIGLVEDISPRKEAEAERDSLVGRLQRSNEDFESFAHAASHDLRSPLRTMKTMAQLLSREYKDRLDAKAFELIGFITSSATRMDTLISDLLEFSKANQGGMALADVDLEECLQDALNNLVEAMEESGAAIHTGKLPVVRAQRTQVVRVFQNLLGNAIKYRRGEPVAVNISAERAGAEWVIRVKDNGMGFDPQYAGEVFHTFRRLHGHEYPGNGIGLASCKRIVERWGGRIWAESEPGVGSTFSFSVPAE